MRDVMTMVAAVLAAIGIGVGVVAAVGGGGLLPAGVDSATIQVVVAQGAPPKFSGSIAGEALNGSYEHTDPTAAKSLCPGTADGSYLYTGTFDGAPYTFSGCISVPPLPKPETRLAMEKYLSHLVLKWRISGSIDGETISGSTLLKATTGGAGLRRASFPISGAIGSETISGTAVVVQGEGDSLLITASLQVS